MMATLHSVVVNATFAIMYRLNTRLYRKRAKGGGEQGEDRGSLWVTPMQWMQELSNGETQGKLYCPRCTPLLTAFPLCSFGLYVDTVCFVLTLVAHTLEGVPFPAKIFWRTIRY